ncbi:MAG: hypothetical protein KC731_13585 [Myxococcales bacterium]|nr:hypothetical protein [Myxococcales bacterium]
MDDRRFALVAVAAVVATIALNSLGLLGEPLAAAIVAAVSAIALAVFVRRETLLAARSRAAAKVASLLAAVTALLMVVPVVATLLPGEPIVHGLLAQGDHLAIPDAAAGPARLLVHASIAGTGAASVEYRLEGLHDPLSGHLERVMGVGRVGRRRVRAANLRDTQIANVELEGQEDLVLRSLSGAADGPLEVTVFRERWPLRWELGLGAALLLATAIVAQRGSLSAALVPVVLAAVTFGVLSLRWLTPTEPLRAELGALVVAGAAGLMGYVPWRWLSLRRAAA